MFKKTINDSYLWEVNEDLYIAYIDESLEDFPTGGETTVVINDVCFVLLGDYRKKFEKTGGNLKAIKQTYLECVEGLNAIYTKEELTREVKAFSNQIDSMIRKH